MLELSCTCMTPSEVLETSGHVEKFADYMVQDVHNGSCHRADKLVKDNITRRLLMKKKKLKAGERA